MKRRVSQLIGLLLGSLFISACSAPVPNPSRTATLTPIDSSPAAFDSVAWQVWPAAPAPQSVSDVAQGNHFMWAGTSFGVVRFDPALRAYTAYDQLGPVLRVFPITDESVYAGTSQGVYYFDGQVWSRVTFTSTYPIWSNSVTAFGLDAQGDLWMLDYASRASRLYRLTGHVPSADLWHATLPDSSVTPAPPLFPFDRPDCDNWPVLATYTYGYRTSTECQHYRHAYTFLEQHGGYGPYAAEADDSFWWISNDQLLHLSASGATLSTHPLFSRSRLAPDPQHGVWIAAGDEGLLYATDSEIQPSSIGLEKYTLFTPHSVAVDTFGRVWATTNRGVQRLAEDWQPATTSAGELIARTDDLPFDLLAAAPQGGMWLANRRELWHYDGNNLTEIPRPHDSDLFTPHAIQADQVGHLWAIGPGCNMLELDPATKRWQRYLPEQNFDQLSIGTDDTVIALSDAGQLFAHPADTAEWKVIAQLDRLSDPVIVADNHGGAWVGLRTTAEVRHYPNGSAQPIVLQLPQKKYFNLFVDRQSHLWLSTSDEILRYDGHDWQTVGAPSIGLVRAFTTVPDGRLWFAGERGIAMFNPWSATTP